MIYHELVHIPWNLLVAHLDLPFATPGHRQFYNLFPRFHDGQGRDLNEFVEIFAELIDAHSKSERNKYAEKYDPPSPDDILLSDDLVKRISPMLHRISLPRAKDLEAKAFQRSRQPRGKSFYIPKLCSHKKDDAECACRLAYEERKASSFLRPYTFNDCYKFWEANGPAFANMEVVKTLLVSGDLEPILRVCAHPDNQLQDWWCVAQCACMNDDYGWNHVMQRALEAYICLNVLYHFHTLRDDSWTMGGHDYRRTKCYQQVVRESVISGTAAVSPLHIDFFGISACQFTSRPVAKADSPFYADLGVALKWGSSREDEDYPYGVMPFYDFIEFERLLSYQPTSLEVAHVLWMLRKTGLPAEVALRILELAEYEPRRLLKVPHDPFHTANKAELQSYLSICWDILVRCDVMGKALGEPIEWKRWVSQCIVNLWGFERKGDMALGEMMYCRSRSGGVYKFI
ncbi:unnamed protein product [Discula destructiva]